MLTSTLFSLMALGTIAVQGNPSRGLDPPDDAKATPPALHYLLTASLSLGKPLKPIPIPGGDRTVTPILNGTISGAVNGIINGGTAYPQRFGNQTVQVPFITAYGVTSDGYSFLIEEQGIGSPQAQFTRIVLEIGGPYRKLTEKFLLTTVEPNKARTGVVVQAYTVGQ